MRRRFFGSVVNNAVVLSTTDSRDIFKKHRLNVGDEFELASLGTVYLCRIINKKPFGAEILHQINENHEISNNVHLIVSACDPKILEKIFYQAPFYGVHQITIFDPKAGKRKGSKIVTPRVSERLKDAIDKGSQEAKRGYLLRYNGAFPLSEIIKVPADYKIFVDLSKNGDTNDLLTEIRKLNKKSSVIMFISPVEGLDETDITVLLKNGYNSVTLSRRILTAEIAPSYALAALACSLEKK